MPSQPPSNSHSLPCRWVVHHLQLGETATDDVTGIDAENDLRPENEIDPRPGNAAVTGVAVRTSRPDDPGESYV